MPTFFGVYSATNTWGLKVRRGVRLGVPEELRGGQGGCHEVRVEGVARGGKGPWGSGSRKLTSRWSPLQTRQTTGGVWPRAPH